MARHKAVFVSTCISMLLFSCAAYAHVGVGQASGFFQGMEHPLTGLDHIAAMVAVGLWAAQQGGRALWVVPLTFVGVMTLGGLIGTLGIAIPFVEQGIIVSVLTLGVLVAAAVRLPLVASSLIVGLFAVLHGHAHGAEMPETASGIAYGLGFLVATAMLHGAGIALALGVRKLADPRFVRVAGLGVIGIGVYLSVV